MDTFVLSILNIVLIDLVLSGDNAIVIGLAVRNLPPRQKNRAILAGTLGAIVLRITLTALATLLLQVPLLKAGGGILLVWITYKLLAPSDDDATHSGPAHDSFRDAIRTIILADLSMSIDNVLAVGAAAAGHLVLLLFGLSLSLMIIMAGGRLIAELLSLLPWLIYIGGGILLILAGEMIAGDALLSRWLGHTAWLPWLLTTAFAIVLGFALWHPWQRARET